MPAAGSKKVDDGKSHFLVGQEMNGSIVVSCIETKTPSGTRWIKIHRDFKLKNGVQFWIDKLVSREKSNETLKEWLKEQEAAKAKREAAQAKARELARQRMQNRKGGSEKAAAPSTAAEGPSAAKRASIRNTSKVLDSLNQLSMDDRSSSSSQHKARSKSPRSGRSSNSASDTGEDTEKPASLPVIFSEETNDELDVDASINPKKPVSSASFDDPILLKKKRKSKAKSKRKEGDSDTASLASDSKTGRSSPPVSTEDGLEEKDDETSLKPRKPSSDSEIVKKKKKKDTNTNKKKGKKRNVGKTSGEKNPAVDKEKEQENGALMEEEASLHNDSSITLDAEQSQGSLSYSLNASAAEASIGSLNDETMRDPSNPDDASSSSLPAEETKKPQAEDEQVKVKKKKKKKDAKGTGDTGKKKKGKSKNLGDSNSSLNVEDLDKPGKKKKKKPKDKDDMNTSTRSTKKKNNKKKRKGAKKDEEKLTQEESDILFSSIHSQLEALFDPSDEEMEESQESFSNPAKPTTAESQRQQDDEDGEELEANSALSTQQADPSAPQDEELLDDSMDFRFNTKLLGPLDDYSSDEPSSGSDDDFVFTRVPGVDDFNNSMRGMNQPSPITNKRSSVTKVASVLKNSNIEAPNLSQEGEDEAPFESLDDVKEAHPNFAKIMGVWVDRESKVTYKTPLSNVEKRSEDEESKPAPAAKEPTLETMVEKWENKLVKEEPEKIESPPRKLRNVWAEKLEFSKPFRKPTHQKSDEEVKLIEDTVEQNFAFKDLTPDEMGPLIDAFERVEYEAGATIGDEGEPECFCSIVQSGEVHFNSAGNQVGKAVPGDAFGELSLLYSCPRPTEVRAAEHQTVLFQIDQTSFRHILREQMIRSQEDKLALLKSVELFQDLDESDLVQLGAAMVPHKFKEGDNLSATFIESPFCLVQQGSVAATDVPVGPGESFGADSLVSNKAPKYEVRAMSDGLAFTIDRKNFEKVFGDFDRVSMKYREKQTLTSIKQIQAAKLNDEQLDTLVRQIAEVKFKPGEEIFEFNSKIKPALYLVRSGEVKVVKKSGEEKQIFPGDYFGQEYMLFTSKQSKDIVPDHIVVKYSAVAMEETVCGMLTLEEVGIVSERIQPIQNIESTRNIALEDLQRHRVLGEGQFGIVWLVTVKSIESDPYALKIQFLDDTSRDDPAECIREEIKMMRSIQHPFIIQVFNTYEDPETISMLLSLAPGGELFDVLHRQDANGWWISGLAEPIAKFYAMVVADTLAFMHRQRYVYRDLKPENILIDQDGYPVLTDFGFVKKLEEDKTYTFCGTPNYVAPEVVASVGHGTPADNWSLGVLIYELLDGANPFWEEGMDQQTLFQLIRDGLYPPISRKRSSRSGRDLIDRLLEKDPSRRLGSFREKDILEHPWFDDFDIEELRDRVIRAPWVPDPISLHCDDEEEEDEY